MVPVWMNERKIHPLRGSTLWYDRDELRMGRSMHMMSTVERERNTVARSIVREGDTVHEGIDYSVHN